jgi:hypothetical protein
VSGETLRAPRLRWSAPVERIGDEIFRSVMKRLGKGCGAVIDALERAGGTATVEQLAAMLHKIRVRDLKQREIKRLEKAGAVECSGEIVTLVADWLDALDRERASAGEIAAYQRDVSRYAQEREAYADRHRIRSEQASENLPAGAIRERERPPEPIKPELVEALRSYLERNWHRREETPSWLRVALWAEDYLPSKPSLEAVAQALTTSHFKNH